MGTVSTKSFELELLVGTVNAIITVRVLHLKYSTTVSTESIESKKTRDTVVLNLTQIQTSRTYLATLTALSGAQQYS